METGTTETTMQRLCWDVFSARYSEAKREELERFPKLNDRWEEWRAAWQAGIEAHISTMPSNATR